jgi:hypothetical protein
MSRILVGVGKPEDGHLEGTDRPTNSSLVFQSAERHKVNPDAGRPMNEFMFLSSGFERVGLPKKFCPQLIEDRPVGNSYSKIPVSRCPMYRDVARQIEDKSSSVGTHGYDGDAQLVGGALEASKAFQFSVG